MLVSSTHQTELVLRRPSVCQQFGPWVHFQNVSSCGAKVEKAVIIGHLGIKEERGLKTYVFSGMPLSPDRGGKNLL